MIITKGKQRSKEDLYHMLYPEPLTVKLAYPLASTRIEPTLRRTRKVLAIPGRPFSKNRSY